MLGHANKEPDGIRGEVSIKQAWSAWPLPVPGHHSSRLAPLRSPAAVWSQCDASSPIARQPPPGQHR
eukprot:4719711-Amphidinium_carterae.1